MTPILFLEEPDFAGWGLSMVNAGKHLAALLACGLLAAAMPTGFASAAPTDAAQATFSATRHEVEGVFRDLFERRMFDPYLQFASKPDEASYRRREALRQEQVTHLLAFHTAAADYQAGLAEDRQFGDAGLHGAADAKELSDDPGTLRAGCVSGATPTALRRTAEPGARGGIDITDACIAAMAQQARASALDTVYEDLVEDEADVPANNAATAASGLPQKIAEAVQAGQNSVDLGGGEGITVTPALALDAGFVAGYGGQAAGMPGKVADPAKLKSATEACLEGRAVSKTCYVVGFIQGGSAYLASR